MNEKNFLYNSKYPDVQNSRQIRITESTFFLVIFPIAIEKKLFFERIILKYY